MSDGGEVSEAGVPLGLSALLSYRQYPCKLGEEVGGCCTKVGAY